MEAGSIHEHCGPQFLTVTPGIRLAGGSAGDQKRVTTPAQAREFSSDYIVVGRPITQADDLSPYMADAERSLWTDALGYGPF